MRLPSSLQQRLDLAVSGLLNAPGTQRVDFCSPPREEALLAPDSVSWRIFKNPIALFVGGVAGVILELADPSVRTGVWEHSTFRSDPMRRLQRTGLAAMVTIYGPRSVAEPMIAGISRMHAKVMGETPRRVAYSASNTRLLTWVHATAAFAFGQAYSRYVAPLSDANIDALYREGAPVSRLYGAADVPTSRRELELLFDSAHGLLEPSPIVFQFLQIMRDTRAFPGPLRWTQGTLVRAAVELVPEWMRQRLGLTARYGLRRGERSIVNVAGAISDRIILTSSPAIQSCLRLGLPMTHLYR